MNRKLAIRLAVLAAIAISCTASHAQQMAMERAAETYKKRMELAEAAKKTSLEKINAAHKDGVNKATEETKQRLNLAIREATGRGETEEAEKLQEVLDTISGGGAAAPKREKLTDEDCEKILEQLVGTWQGSTDTYSSKNAQGQMEVTSKTVYTYEFKTTKRMIRTATTTYLKGGGSPSKSTEEFKAMIRGNGKITFELVSLTGYRSVKEAPTFELALPFNPEAPKLIHRGMRSGSPFTNNYNLKKIK